MQSPAVQGIRSEFDPQGRLVLSWDVMGPVMSRVIASMLAGVAALWVWIGHTMPKEFWGLLYAKDPQGPDWMGLAITGGGSLFCGAFALLTVFVASQIAFRPKPERLLLGQGKLVYHAGAAALVPGATGRAPFFRALFQAVKYEVAAEDCGGASLGSYKGIQFVALQMGPRQVQIGRFLRADEQVQLVGTITQWQQKH